MRLGLPRRVVRERAPPKGRGEARADCFGGAVPSAEWRGDAGRRVGGRGGVRAWLVAVLRPKLVR